MALTITIKGSGKVDKVVSEDTTTLTAIPNEEWLFKNFKIGADLVTQNPYTFAQSEDMLVVATFYLSIVSYLKGRVGFEVSETAINGILTDRNVSLDADSSDLLFKEKELLYADLLMWGATLPTSFSGAKDSDGGWSHSEGSSTIQATDKKRFEGIANEIYRKYNDSRKAKSSIIFLNLNGKQGR